MSEGRKPSAPTGLAARGVRFWRETLATWDLTKPELTLLEMVCRSLERVDALEAVLARDGLQVDGSKGQPVAHWALPQLRAERAQVAKLLAQLELPDERGEVLSTPWQARARKAAESRWRRRHGDTAGREGLREVRRGTA